MPKESLSYLASRVEKLLHQASETQVKKFLKQSLLGNGHIIHDFEIFMQGPKQTKATTQSYKSKIVGKLDELDLDELEQAWMTSGDDFYDYYPSYKDDSCYDDKTLNLTLSPFLQEAQKYANNENYTESDKIFQATIEALRDKIEEIKDGYPDLEDWLFKEIDETLNSYCKVLQTTESSIKQAGLEYICMLFEHKQFDQNRKELEKCLKEMVIKNTEAKICLRRLSCTINKPCLLPDESSLLAHLYLLASNEEEFEKVSTDNLTSNPQLVLELLKFYKSHNRKTDVLKTADQVLDHIHKKADSFDWNFSENLEIGIREFLKTVFDPKTEYRQTINNMEILFRNQPCPLGRVGYEIR